MQNKQKDTYILLNQVSKGDNAALEKLTEENMGLVVSCAKKFQNRGIELDDLVQIGAIGLINAINKFDSSYDVMFSTYAVPLIMGEIKRYLRDNGPIKVSRSYRVLSSKVLSYRERFSQIYGREPTISEISEELSVEKEEITSALEATIPPESIYKTVDSDEKIHLIDKISGGENSQENNIIDKITLKESINRLEPRERKIIILRYFKDKKQGEIADILGISQVQVSRLEKKILSKIKENIS